VGRRRTRLVVFDGGRRYPPSRDVIEQIRIAAKDCHRLGELLTVFGWDDVAAAAADLAFYFDVTKRMDERTPISTTQAPDFYDYLFLESSIPTSWWDSLSKVEGPRD